MLACHQHHNISWQVLLEFERPRRRRRSKKEELAPGATHRPTPVWDKKKQHFSGQLETTICDFAATEAKKYDAREVARLTALYTEDEIDESSFDWREEGVLQKFQSPKQWRDLISGYKRDGTEFRSAPPWQSEIVKELFNQGNMRSLLHLARHVPGIENFSWQTYSNLFHFGFSNTVEDALLWYLHSNYIMLQARPNFPKAWPVLKLFLSSRDFDAHLKPYRAMLKEHAQGPLSQDCIRESQKYAFEQLYKYQLFWTEICGVSEAKPIDWRAMISNALESVFLVAD